MLALRPPMAAAEAADASRIYSNDHNYRLLCVLAVCRPCAADDHDTAAYSSSLLLTLSVDRRADYIRMLKIYTYQVAAARSSAVIYYWFRSQIGSHCNRSSRRRAGRENGRNDREGGIFSPIILVFCQTISKPISQPKFERCGMHERISVSGRLTRQKMLNGQWKWLIPYRVWQPISHNPSMSNSSTVCLLTASGCAGELRNMFLS